MSLDIEKLRAQFPALQARLRKKPYIYLDNACMTLKPEAVISAMDDYYRNFPGCHGRADHYFGAETSKLYEAARRKTAAFFNAADAREIVFTRNSTEGLNLLAYTLPLQAGDVIISSDLEHNSNLLPWQALEKRKGVKRLIISTKPDTSFDLERFRQQMSREVKLVTVLYTSNLSGVSFPIADITAIAHEYGALVCVDAAQAALNKKIDVRGLDIDFMVTSLHKMWGPTGMGVLYGKRKLLESLPQFLYGGGTVDDVSYSSQTCNPMPDKFEAGLQNYAGALGSAAALELIRKTGQEEMSRQVQELNQRASEAVLALPGISLIGPSAAEARSSILNVNISGIDVAHAARLLHESEGVMVRFGKHCVHAWFSSRRQPDSLRFSFAAYNTIAEVDSTVRGLESVLKFCRR